MWKTCRNFKLTTHMNDVFIFFYIRTTHKTYNAQLKHYDLEK